MTSPVLVHGATGFTGGLVCRALQRKGIAFAVSGRSETKLRSLVTSLGGGIEHHVVDLAAADSVRAAIAGRKIVCACAGPFLEIGEPILAFCARAGVHYVDTTGEQAFALLAVRYRATAEASGACVVPAMGYEIALADWGADIAAKRLTCPVTSIAICYALREPGGAYASRGTLRSVVTQFSSPESKQLVDGALVQEPAAEHVRTFRIESLGKSSEERWAVSFPGPEAVVVASHTGARTVRTFMTSPRARARVLHATRGIVPGTARLASRLLNRLITSAPEGPDDAARARTGFEIVIEAEGPGEGCILRLVGKDPYGITGEIQTLCAERAVSGAITARGVVAPSVAFDASESLRALAVSGVSLR